MYGIYPQETRTLGRSSQVRDGGYGTEKIALRLKHPDTLQSIADIAFVYNGLGRLLEAEFSK
jgi:hypothetical protein